MDVAYIKSFTVQYCSLITLSVFWPVFVTFFCIACDVLYDFIFKKFYILTIKTCIEVLARNAPYVRASQMGRFSLTGS